MLDLISVGQGLILMSYFGWITYKRFLFFVSIAHYYIYYLFNYGFFSSFLRIFIGGKMKTLFINSYEHKAFISLFSVQLLDMRFQ